jgi:hypothetical protein
MMAYLPPVGPANFNVNRGTANDKLERLVDACRDGRTPAVEMLIRDMSPEEINMVSSTGYLPITAAIEGRDKEAIYALFKKGASFTAKDDAGRSAESMVKDLPPAYSRLKVYIETLVNAQKFG